MIRYTVVEQEEGVELEFESNITIANMMEVVKRFTENWQDVEVESRIRYSDESFTVLKIRE